MNRDTLASFSKEELIALIEALTKQISMLTKRVEALEAELGKPPKTPDNSSVPPSQGHKANGESETKPKAKAHAGSHRPLHPNPTRRRDVLADRCEHCRADVSAVLQTAVHAYDRIEIPEIVPEVTRVTLHGGLCPCCRQRFRAPPPAGLAPCSRTSASGRSNVQRPAVSLPLAARDRSATCLKSAEAGCGRHIGSPPQRHCLSVPILRDGQDAVKPGLRPPPPAAAGLTAPRPPQPVPPRDQ